jgi:hypothetical protein
MSERDAFEAMTRFLTEYHRRAGDDLVTLLADIGMDPTAGPWTPRRGTTAFVASGRSRTPAGP